ncbi:Rieske 2Fe-2S domain-containing protein [Nocardioides sp. LMS-CY]|uniref:Rieske 2Fe-2S domain-containing protein n=2 Tax=Nocardioides TaxID=1839 RepID=UPI00160EDC27|nr:MULTISPECIES: Rieske 2Fe-2S domain-containing protein [Nocardioides]QWF20989.1 Rieske 2Fe-2S domain-containing protein [Nocardioides sp. LMS-CY]
MSESTTFDAVPSERAPAEPAGGVLQPIAWQGEVEEEPVALSVGGQPAVLFRDPAGDVAALHDVCPHLGYPLSGGKLTPLGLQCGVHRYQFDGRGICRSVPRGDPADVKAAEVLPIELSDRLVLAIGEPGVGSVPIAALTELTALVALLAATPGPAWGRSHCAAEDPCSDGGVDAGRWDTMVVGSGGSAPTGPRSVSAALEQWGGQGKPMMVDVPGSSYPTYAKAVLGLSALDGTAAVRVVVPASGPSTWVVLSMRTGPLAQSVHHTHLFVTARLAWSDALAEALTAALPGSATGWRSLLDAQ